MTKLLREHRKDYITAFELFYEEVGQTVGFAFQMGLPGVLATTTMAPAVSLALMPHLQEVASHIASTTMTRIDKDVVFQAMSLSHIRFMQAYSDELGKILDQNTANKVKKVIASTLEQRGSVQDVIQALKDEPTSTARGRDVSPSRRRSLLLVSGTMNPTGNNLLSLVSSGYTAEGAKISPVRRTSH